MHNSARLRTIYCAISLTLAGVLSTPVCAQPLAGALQGNVRATTTNAPLAYAVISVPQLSIERFSDGAGRFALTDLPPGRYVLQVRRIGYSPHRSEVTIQSGVVTRLDVQLTAIPVSIQSLTVRAMVSCTNPGAPDSVSQREVATLVALLRENADRYRLLASQYPFTYRQLRALGEYTDNSEGEDGVLLLQLVDTATANSNTRVVYKAGEVVQRSRAQRGGEIYSMVIPTILDLADNAFLRSHCFAFGGKVESDDETWLRLDVRASDRLRSPDVHGSFYLDSATSQLRRMDLELSRPDRLPRQLQGIESVQVRTKFLEIAPGLSIIDAVCGVNRTRVPGDRRGQRNAPRLALATELQLLSSYQFREAPAGVLEFRNMVTPRWVAGSRLPRSALWCLD